MMDINFFDLNFMAQKIFKTLLGSVWFFLAIALLCLYFEIITPAIYNHLGGSFDGKSLPSIVFIGAFANLCFFVTPAMLSTFIFRESLASLGLQLPKHIYKTILWIVASLILTIPLMIFFSKQPECQRYYSLGSISLPIFVLIHLTIVPIYYFAEEFFFRGFLFLGLMKRIGMHSYWVTEILFVIAHFTKPGFEILLSIPVGILLSFITLRLKSVFPAMIVHYILGITLNICVNYHN